MVEVGEACDDSSACCDATTCQLAAGAECSGECCDGQCAFKTPTDRCGASLQGWCQHGACIETSALCTKYGATVDSSACPIWADQPCVIRCLDPNLADCLHHPRRFGDAHELNFMPDGTPCAATQAANGVCVAGWCEPRSTACDFHPRTPPLPPPLPSSPPTPSPPPVPSPPVLPEGAIRSTAIFTFAGLEVTLEMLTLILTLP